MSATRVIMSYAWDKRSHVEPEVTTLKEEVAQIASRELREDKNVRDQSLQQFREWIAKTQDIHNCRTDSNFLLRFLRVKKFSVPMAEQTLLKYLNLRQTFPHLFRDLDILCPSVNALITSGYIYVSPFRDDHGRRVVIYCAQKLDPYKFTNVDQAKATMLTYEALLDDENTQVLGITHVADVQNVGVAHLTLWGGNEFATIIKWGEQSIPMRHKVVHWLNLPSVLAWLRDFVLGRFSSKIKSRFLIHNSVSDMLKTLNPRVLPKEYGGTMPQDEMIDLWKKELLSKRDKILALDQMELLSDKSIIRRHDNNNTNAMQNGISSLPGSFRRLEVD